MSQIAFRSFSHLELRHDSIPSEHPEAFPFTTVNNVRITPSEMIFENAYEGKHYERKLIFQNVGERLAFVRLTKPTSSTFKYKEFHEGLHLSAGMRIERTVRYVYRSALGVLHGFTTICINDTEIEYKFLVVLSTANLSVEPQLLDFGRIDAVNHTRTMTFYLRNTGYKGTPFAVDLGRNPLNLLVDPIKGMVPARSVVPVAVEIVGNHEGEFTEEFFIKSAPPQRIVVTGRFISPKLLVRKFIHGLDFTLVEFPPTYYGSASVHTLFIKNFSSSQSMFCVMADIQNHTMTLDEAREIDVNYHNYHIHPLDGRLAALGGALIQTKFAPVTSPKEKPYAICFIKIIRMDCRDVSEEDRVAASMKRIIYSDVPTDTLSIGYYSLTRDQDVGENSLYSMTALSLQEERLEERFSFEHAIGVCLYGEKEVAGVSLRPTAINLEDLVLGQVSQREVRVTNKSKRLPIRVKYKKVPSVDVRPSSFDLQPSQAIEVLITIRSLKLYKTATKVVFELLSFDNMPDSVASTVGKAMLKLAYNTTSMIKKERLDQCKLCNLLPPKVDQGFPYRLNAAELLQKEKNDNYYLEYIRSKIKPQPDPNKDEYQLTKTIKIKGEHMKCVMPPPAERKVVPYCTLIPLAPRLLYNIKIIPKSIRLRKVASHTTITDYFTIQNNNSFPIFVFVSAAKSCIVFAEHAHVIPKEVTTKIYFTFSNNNIGTYYINLFALINCSTLYTVNAVAHVVPKTLRTDTSNIEFIDGEDNYKFFKMINVLNAYTSFDWNIAHASFRIYPDEGGIQAERDMYVMATYEYHGGESNHTECVLTSESGVKDIVSLVFVKKEHAVVFDNYDIDVGNVPINLPVRKKFCLKNLKSSQVTFSIPGHVTIPGIEIYPVEGVLKGLDSQVFTVIILFKTIIEFSTKIVFNIDEEIVCVALRGKVCYPDLEIKPEMLQFRKIAPFSFDVLAFRVTNISPVETEVTFPLEEFPEFSVSESEYDYNVSVYKVILMPTHSRIFFLHFHPQHISSYSFSLPYVINGILGPVLINSTRSTYPEYYLKDHNQQYEKVQDVVVKKPTNLLPLLRVNSSALEKLLHFSQMTLNMCYYGDDNSHNHTTTTVEITNCSSDVAVVCLRIDYLQAPFSLVPLETSLVEYHGVAYKFSLQPNQTITFEANFFPFEMGNYQVKLPIFLRHYYDNKVFNYLILKGVYSTPSIVASVDRIDFEPTPPKINSEVTIAIKLTNHFRYCELYIDMNFMGMTVNWPDGKSPRNEVDVLRVVLEYSNPTFKCVNGTMYVRCSCGGAAKGIKVTGVIESNFLTTHAFWNFLTNDAPSEEKATEENGTQTVTPIRPRYFYDLTNYNQTCFPFFPSDDNRSDYGNYMRRVQKALEKFLFSQVFYLNWYYKIPEGFSDYCKVNRPAEMKVFGGLRKQNLLELPVLDLMENLAGRAVRNKLAPSLPKDDNDIDWMVYAYKTNHNILQYLSDFPVFLPHVTPKLLLNYDQYLLYQKLKHPEDETMDERTFFHLSKQCWIDLILQIIKAFFLYRAVLPPTSNPLITVRRSQTGFSRVRSMSIISRSSLEPESVTGAAIYGDHERELIEWMKNCYLEQKGNLWSAVPPDKDIVYLDEDLRDGLLLGAVTAHCCPYVVDEIKNMYVKTENPEELFHNLCVLVVTWKKLRFSYILSPLELMNATMVEMLLLVTYLYNVLPNYTPLEEVTIEAPLTQTKSANIELKNLGVSPVYYKVVFFGDTNNLFNGPPKITIEPGHKKTVKIRYHAKSVTTAHATVLFSGETPGFKYGVSVVVTLKGVADVSFSCMEIPLTLDLYRPCNVVLHTESPFKIKAEYEVLFGYEPASKDKKALFPWKDIKGLKIVKELMLEDEKHETDEDGTCSSSHFFCCLQYGARNMWLCFTNPEIGDWGVQLSITSKVTDDCFEIIKVVLPEDYDSFTCNCKDNKFSVIKNCPLVLHAKLPMKNNPLWMARKNVVMQHVTREEYHFWSKRIYTPVGTRILKLMLNSETHPMRQVIEETVEYKVAFKKKKTFFTFPTVVFEDVTSENYFDFPLHPLKPLEKSTPYEMKLVSADEKETRFYKLYFMENGGEIMHKLE